MVGGYLIEKFDINNTFTRLWVMDPNTNDEMCVMIENQEDMPELGKPLWWQSGKVYFDNDTKCARKVGNSYTPNKSEYML